MGRDIETNGLESFQSGKEAITNIRLWVIFLRNS